MYYLVEDSKNRVYQYKEETETIFNQFKDSVQFMTIPEVDALFT